MMTSFSLQWIGPITSLESIVEWWPDFIRRWIFVAKRSPGDLSSRMMLMKERDLEHWSVSAHGSGSVWACILRRGRRCPVFCQHGCIVWYWFGGRGYSAFSCWIRSQWSECTVSIGDSFAEFWVPGNWYFGICAVYSREKFGTWCARIAKAQECQPKAPIYHKFRGTRLLLVRVYPKPHLKIAMVGQPIPIKKQIRTRRGSVGKALQEKRRRQNILGVMKLCNNII